MLRGGEGNDSLSGESGNNALYGDGGDDILRAGSGSDTLHGGDGNDNLYGGPLATLMYGGAGNDTLRGGTDTPDTMDGGAGNDDYYVYHAATVVTEALGGGLDTVRTTVSFALDASAEVEVVRINDQTSTDALDLTGSNTNNELRGNNGNNRLDGRGGADTLRGFLGNDIYIIDDAGDRVFEADGEGTDTILTAINTTLGSTVFVENLHALDATSTTGLILTGNQLANDIRGTAGGDRLSGGDGDDTLRAGAGDDTLYGGAGTDRVVMGVASTTVNAVAGASSMILTSAEGADFIANDVEFIVFTDTTLTYAQAAALTSTPVDPTLRGTPGNDTLFGGAGNDTIYGDAGNDSLVGNAGNDQIYGEAGNDILRGNAGFDTLDGGEGNDTIFGDADAPDTMIGGAGDDLYYANHAATVVTEALGGGLDTVRTTVSFALDASAEVEVVRINDQTSTDALDLTGSNTNNELRGNNGNNRLDGRGGADTLRGFLGNDIYIIDDAGDRVFEADGEGTDTILTAINTTLGSTVFVENLHALDATSTTGLILTGNQLANDIRGTAGGDRLSGGDGDDTLRAGAGDDTLYGGAGTDRVVMGVASTTVNAVAGASSMILTSAEGADFIANDVEFIVFTDTTLTYAQAALLRAETGPAPIRGTSNAENLTGTASADLIEGLGGNDWITPGTGSDTIDGGDGRDMVSFVDLPDTPGRTAVQYRLDLDLTAGTATTSGADTYTLRNIERVTGTIFADRIKGTAGDDELRGLGDYDWFVATTGADTLNGGTGADMVSYFEWSPGGANDGVDPLSTNGRAPGAADVPGVIVNLSNTANNTNLAAGHSYVSIERITGSSWVDVFWGDANENDFRGLGGFDWFVGSTGGRERYFGGDGVDTVTYFNSSAGIIASLMNGARVGGQETGFGTGGDAARDLYFEIENLVGTEHADRITGNSGRNTLMGLGGDDFIFGGAGIDLLHGGTGNDTVDGGAGSDYAIFTGNRADYALNKTSGTTVTVTGPDGVDSLINVEYFRFADMELNIWGLASGWN